MTAESAYRVFFETYNNLEANRKQQRLLLKPMDLEAFNNDAKLMLEDKSKDLRWVVDEVPSLRDIKRFRTDFVGDCGDTFQAYKTVKAAHQIESESSSLLEKLKTENLSNSDIVKSGGTVSQKLDKVNAEW